MLILFLTLFLSTSPLTNVGNTTIKSENKDECNKDSIHNRYQEEGNRTCHICIPERSTSAMQGSQFMDYIKDMSFNEREQAILKELQKGNIPSFLRNMITLQASFRDKNNIAHNVKFSVMPDYLAIGSDKDFCRVPMGPITAQHTADLYGACLPTRKLVDYIYKKSEVKLAPVSYWPIDNQNEQVFKFVEHNAAIEKQRIAAGGKLGQLTAGTKKDVVLSNKIIDPARPGHVVIYGWHKLDGIRIQPLTNIHYDWYVDYSHGIRLLDSQVVVDGKTMMLQNLLSDSILFSIFSDEPNPMKHPTYLPADHQ